MLKSVLPELFERDLRRLEQEIILYKQGENMWIVRPGINNSGGNLCLHLMGNLNHFIGAALGNTGYIRQRDLEFSLKNVPRGEMLSSLQSIIEVVTNTLRNLPEEAFEQVYPLPKDGRILQTDFLLLHLLSHLSYHLGQINYHRRLVEEVA